MRRTDADAGIRCPNCGCTFSSVVNTESITNAIRRRRECLECGVRWNTYEYMVHRDVMLEREKNSIMHAREGVKNVINNAIEALRHIDY